MSILIIRWKKLLKLLGGILLVMMIISLFLYFQINKSYSDIISMNWSIRLPNSYIEVYSAQGDVNFHGDGPRYHILEYKNDKDMDLSVNWENNKNLGIEAAVGKILSTLNVSKDNMLNFQSKYKYYTKEKNGLSKIYLIYFADTKKLYVIEDII